MISTRNLKTLGTSTLLCGLAVLLPPPPAGADALLDLAEGSAIQTTFGAYKAAILEDQGEAAAKLVTQNTLDYFREAKELALYGTASELQERTLTDRMQIAYFRHRIPLETLQELSAAEIFQYAVDRGWVGKNSVTPISLGDLEVEDGRAQAQALVNGQPVPFHLYFAKESDSWKLDLVPLLGVGDSAFHQLAEQRGITGDDLILQLLSAVSGVEVGKDIWDPPLSREEKN